MTSPILDQKLAYWIDHRINVLFRGKHGVEKAAVVTAAFDQAGVRGRFISAPGSSVDEIFSDAAVEALFFDDLDRVPKKIREVVLNLLKEKSDRLPNLKIVWAAVGVDYEEYDQEDVSPAGAELFDVVVTDRVVLSPGLR